MKANPAWILGGLIVVFALGACGPKRPRFDDPPPELTPEMRDQIQQRLNFHDLNEDGAVTCADVAFKRAELFTLVDKDENGGLDSGEYMDLRWHDKLYVLLELPNDDLDKNGMVSLEEFQQRRDPFFGRIDTDNNCTISIEEYQLELRIAQQERFRLPDGGRPPGKRRRANT